jgi:hypothetical protein
VLAQGNESEASLVAQQAQKRAAQEHTERLQAAIEQVHQVATESKSSREPRASTTDPQGRMMKQPDGGFAPSYNVQTTTAAVGKAIVAVQVTQAGNDFAQLTDAIDRLQRTLDCTPAQTVVDGGYISQANILQSATSGVELIGPVMRAEAKAAQCYGRSGVKPEFYVERFRFDASANCFYCPQGVQLTAQGKTKSEVAAIYKYQAKARDCAGCASKGDCCPKSQKTGRSVQRSEYHQEINDFQQRMATPEKQEIYHQRSEVAETPHLWMKAKFGLRQFHVRGLVKVGMEALWAALTYNIVLLLRCRRQAASA